MQSRVRLLFIIGGAVGDTVIIAVRSGLVVGAGLRLIDRCDGPFLYFVAG